MKRSLLTLALILSYTTVHAETAILCGEDVSAFADNDKAAEVWVRIDQEEVQSTDDVGFFHKFGVNQDLISASTVNGKIHMSTADEQYVFDAFESYMCEGGEDLKVQLVVQNKKLKCSCFQD